MGGGGRWVGVEGDFFGRERAISWIMMEKNYSGKLNHRLFLYHSNTNIAERCSKGEKG